MSGHWSPLPSWVALLLYLSSMTLQVSGTRPSEFKQPKSSGINESAQSYSQGASLATSTEFYSKQKNGLVWISLSELNSRAASEGLTSAREASESATTEREANESAVSERVANVRSASTRLSSEISGGENVPSEKVPSERSDSKRMLSESASSETVTSESASSEKGTSESAASEKGTSESAASEEGRNERSVTSKSLASKSIPSEIADGEKIPSKRVPTKWTVIKRVTSVKAISKRATNDRTFSEQTTSAKAATEKATNDEDTGTLCAYRVVEKGEEGRLCFRHTQVGFTCPSSTCRQVRSPGGNLLANMLSNGSVLLQWTYAGWGRSSISGSIGVPSEAPDLTVTPAAGGDGETLSAPPKSPSRGQQTQRRGFRMSCWWNGSYTQFECASVILGNSCRDFLLTELHENMPYRICLQPLWAVWDGAETGNLHKDKMKTIWDGAGCVDFSISPSGMQDIVIAMTTVGGAICVMLVIICLLVAYITENIMSPSVQHTLTARHSTRSHNTHL